MKIVPGSSARPDWPLALVFGAGGLGMAVARRLGQSHRVLLLDRDQEHLDAQIAAMTAAGFDATGQACDVTRFEDLASAAATAEQLGGLRSAAYVVGLSPSLGDFNTIMAVNLVAPARVLGLLRDVVAPGGAMLCISSSAATHGASSCGPAADAGRSAGGWLHRWFDGETRRQCDSGSGLRAVEEGLESPLPA